MGFNGDQLQGWQTESIIIMKRIELVYCYKTSSIKDPVLPIKHCGHFCDVENSEAFVSSQNSTL